MDPTGTPMVMGCGNSVTLARQPGETSNERSTEWTYEA